MSYRLPRGREELRGTMIRTMNKIQEPLLDNWTAEISITIRNHRVVVAHKHSKQKSELRKLRKLIQLHSGPHKQV